MEPNEDQSETLINTDESPKRFHLKYLIEVPLMLTMFSVALSGAPIGNIIMYRTCVHSLNYSRAECRSFLSPDSINHSKELETAVQQYATAVSTVRAVLEAAGPAVLALFLGVWSDTHGRKPLLVWSLFGMTLSAMLMVVYSTVDGVGPWWIILTVIPFSLTGGFCILVTGGLCYVNDVTTEDNRSLRLLLIQVAIAVGVSAGGMLSPYLLKAVGNVYLLLIVAALYTISYASTNVFIEESMTNAVPGNILTVFNLSHVKVMMKSCFEEKPNYGRGILLMIIGVSSLSVFSVYGTSGLMYLYTRAKLQWTMKDYTTFSSTSSVMWFMGSILGIGVLQKTLHLSDLNFVIISFLSCIAEFITKTLATSTWHMYLGSALSLFGTLYGALIRSFLTKAVPSTDIAKVFCLIGAMESFCPLISPLVYNALYATTLTTFPAAFLVLSAGVYAVNLALILIIQFLRRKTSSKTYQRIETGDGES